jgi:hypothetical protein
MHTNNQPLEVAKAVALVNQNLLDLGFSPRDADGSDYQRGLDTVLRFKTGCSYGEVTALVMVDNRQAEAIRATSWAGIDRMLLAIRQYVDQTPPRTTVTGAGL